MIMYNLKRDVPWFFHYIENYYHIFLNVRFNGRNAPNEEIPFSIGLNLQGFEGLIFYIYKSHANKIKFDLYKHSIDQIYEITNLNYFPSEEQIDSLDFVIIPFGYFKDEHRFDLYVHSDKIESSFDIFAWAPSNLFRNIKSVIKIDNQYNELIPIDDYKGYYFQLSSAFKGNQTGRLFDLINLLVDLDKSLDEITNEPLFEPMDSEIKLLVSKSNEFLFELCQKSVPLEIKSLLRELERLKFNIDNLTKEEIFNWLDDIIDFYSGKT